MQQYSTSRRRRQLLRVLTYVVMSVAVIGISAICILLVLGYQFNFQKRTVEQGGLLQFQSFPNGATVNLDGQVLSFNTPGKSNVDVGNHSVTYQKSGYRTWSKNFPLKAGELRWLNYARLIPNSVTTNSLLDTSGIASEKPSPDRNWLALVTDATLPKITIVDLRNSSKVLFDELDIPTTAYTAPADGKTQLFSVVEWDFGGRYILVRHDYDGKSEFLRLDRTDVKNSKDISTQLGVSLSDIHFSGTNGNTFYGVENGNLRKIDIGSGSLSEPIAKNVTSFTLYSTSDIAYVTHQAPHYSVGIYVSGTAHIVNTVDDTQPVLVDSSSYFSDRYIAISYGTSTTIIKDPQDILTRSTKSIKMTFLGDVKWLEFSNNGRFVVAGSGGQFVTYDLETSQTFNTNLPGTAADNSQPLQWIDDYMFAWSADNNLRLSEFDGANEQVITDALPSYAVTLSEDGKYIYSFAKSDKGVTLQASRLVL